MAVTDTPWKAIDIPAIRECNVGSYQRASFFCRFNHDRTIRDSGDNPVPPEEIWTVWFCAAGKIGQQTARFQHFDSRIPMAGRIDTIQAMRQHSNSRKSVVQGVPVGTDIDAVSQSTHDQQVRDHFCQVFYKGFGKLPTIFGRVASTHNTDDTGCIKVSISLKIEKYRGIRTFSQAHRIICISQIITGNIVFLNKRQLFFRPLQDFRAFDFGSNIAADTRDPS